MTIFRDYNTGLEDHVAREWGYPRLVKTYTTYSYECGCEHCEYHEESVTHDLPESEWYWMPSVVDMGLMVPMLQADRGSLYHAIRNLGLK